jgi:hypothetical protein
MFVTTPWAAYLSNTMTAIDNCLPLDCNDSASLLLLLANSGDYTYLVVADDMGTEIVKATRVGDIVTITRALDGTTARAFPPATCVSNRPSYAGIKDLICNYDCCAAAP